MDAYLEGDVAHFYFEVTDYVKPAIGRSTARKLLNKHTRFRVTRNKGAAPSFAHMSAGLKLGAPPSRDALAFQEFVSRSYKASEWRTRNVAPKIGAVSLTTPSNESTCEASRFRPTTAIVSNRT